MKNQTACFTGPRVIPAGQRKTIEKRLHDEVVTLIEQGYRYFGAGGALGFDTMAAQTVLQLKSQYPQIRLILVLPCRTQTRGWPERDIAVYQSIMAQADKVVYTSDEYTGGCMFKRNRHLVDHSSACICYLTSDRGGTAYTVDYALSKGVRVISLA